MTKTRFLKLKTSFGICYNAETFFFEKNRNHPFSILQLLIDNFVISLKTRELYCKKNISNLSILLKMTQIYWFLLVSVSAKSYSHF